MPGDGARRLGRYRLLRVVARDAVSTTYVAASDAGALAPGGGHVALRVIDRVDGGDAQATETARQFLVDARQAAVVDHPTVLRPVDVGMVDGQAFVATPYLRAVPLAELLAHGGRIAAAPALAMFAQLAGGLDAAHRAGLVHGALNPLTVWVAPTAAGTSYVAHLTGFGSIRLLRQRLAEARGAVVADVLYLAPEQLRGAPAGPASDQYALACAVYHALTGAPPFVHDTRAKLFGAHLLAPAPDLVTRDPATAGSTRAALRRGMAKQPGARFASCGEMIHEALPAAPEEDAAPRAPVVGRRRRERGTGARAPVMARRRRERGTGARAPVVARRRGERGTGAPLPRPWRALLLTGVTLLVLAGAFWMAMVASGG